MSPRLARLVEFQSGICYYYGDDFDEALKAKRPTIEHKEPLSRGGRNRSENRVAACYSCNDKKGPLTEAEFWACYVAAWREVQAKPSPHGLGPEEYFSQRLTARLKGRSKQIQNGMQRPKRRVQVWVPGRPTMVTIAEYIGA